MSVKSSKMEVDQVERFHGLLERKVLITSYFDVFLLCTPLLGSMLQQDLMGCKVDEGLYLPGICSV